MTKREREREREKEKRETKTKREKNIIYIYIYVDLGGWIKIAVQLRNVDLSYWFRGLSHRIKVRFGLGKCILLSCWFGEPLIG